MKKIIIALMLFSLMAQAQQPTITYQETLQDFSNPERGFYYYSISWIPNSPDWVPGSPFHYIPIQQYEIDDCHTGNFSLIQRIIRLDDYRSGAAIPQGFLDLIEDDFQLLQANGIKCILRFSYSEPNSVPQTPFEPTEAGIIGHINQLDNLTQQYEEVISSVEAGFIGRWGEWFTTTNFGTPPSLSPAHITARTNVATAIMGLTVNRATAFRTPQFQRLLAPNLNGGKTAPYHNGTIYSRIACHDDAFTNGITDQGTFTFTNDRSYLHTKSKYTFTGGESNNNDPAYNSCTSTANPLGMDALDQLREYHYNYLNSSWFDQVVDPVTGVWASTPMGVGNCLDEVKRRLGYRFVLVNSSVNTTSNKLVINLRNDGYANVFNRRTVYLVLQNTTNGNTYKVNIMGPTDGILAPTVPTDVRMWQANDYSVIPTPAFTVLSKSLANMTLAVAAPGLPVGSFVPSGFYNLYLELPDEDALLDNDPRNSIRFANGDGYTNSLTGNQTGDFWVNGTYAGVDYVYNNLFRTLTVAANGNASKMESAQSIAFDVISSPNPFNQGFKLNISTASEENITVKVYDMLGKLIEDTTVAVTELENAAIGSKLAIGIYNVVVKQGQNEKTVRVIKN